MICTDVLSLLVVKISCSLLKNVCHFILLYNMIDVFDNDSILIICSVP